MTRKHTKVSLLPVTKDSEVDYYLSRIWKILGSIRQKIDDYGKQYDHESPWDDVYLESPKYWLRKVKIGVIGRISSSESAAKLGLLAKIPASSHHFTSMALYYIFRIARQMRREYAYVEKLEKWMESYLNEVNPDARFLVYNKAYGKEND